MTCHRFTAALMAGRAVVTPGVQSYDVSEIAALAIPCIGSECALWMRGEGPRGDYIDMGSCSDNRVHDRLWPDPAKVSR